MIQEAIASAKELILKAFLLTKVHSKQLKLLDLLEVFKEYTETKKMQSASKVVATQVASLNITIKKLEARARQLVKPQSVQHTQHIQPTQTQSNLNI